MPLCVKNLTNAVDSMSLVMVGRGRSKLSYAAIGFSDSPDPVASCATGVAALGSTPRNYGRVSNVGGLAAMMAVTVARLTRPYAAMPSPGANASSAAKAADLVRKKSLSVMRAGVLAPEGVMEQMYCVPDVTHHREIPLWDTVFSAVGMAAHNGSVAWQELQSLLRNQRQDGRVGLASNPDGTVRDVKRPCTQYPLIAWAVLQLHRRAGSVVDAAALAWVLPKLEAYLQWDLDHRDINKNGLLEWLEPDESGWVCELLILLCVAATSRSALVRVAASCALPACVISPVPRLCGDCFATDETA